MEAKICNGCGTRLDDGEYYTFQMFCMERDGVIAESEQVEELGKELKKLSAIRGRWMKNIWMESAILASLASLVIFLCGMILLFHNSNPTTSLSDTEKPTPIAIYGSEQHDNK